MTTASDRERLARIETLLEKIEERMTAIEMETKDLTALRNKGLGIMAALSVICIVLGALFGGKLGALFAAMGR